MKLNKTLYWVQEMEDGTPEKILFYDIVTIDEDYIKIVLKNGEQTEVNRVRLGDQCFLDLDEAKAVFRAYQHGLQTEIDMIDEYLKGVD